MELLFKRKGWGDFGPDKKAAAALILIAEWGDDCSNVPPETLEAARKLFREINQRFAPSNTTAARMHRSWRHLS
jgi:hypothetical protein